MRARLICALAVAGLVLGSVLTLLRLVLTVDERLAAGDRLVEAVVFYFSFFSILTNLGLVLAYASMLWGQPAGFGRQWVRSMLSGLILVVMGGYHFLIVGTSRAEGLAWVSDLGMHYVTPVLYLTWWALAERREVPRLGDMGRMMMPPLAYAGYMLARGAATGNWPYRFLDPTRLGAGGVARNMFLFAGAMLVLFAVAAATDRVFGRQAVTGGGLPRRDDLR